MVVDHHVIELYHYQAQKYQTGKIWLFTNIVGVFLNCTYVQNRYGAGKSSMNCETDCTVIFSGVGRIAVIAMMVGKMLMLVSICDSAFGNIGWDEG